MPKYSILIANHHSPCLGAIFDALSRQTRGLDAAEILVVGSGPVPGSGALPVRVIPTGHPVAVGVKNNLGLEQAAGEIIFFLEHDCVPAPDWMQRHLERLAQSETVVGGAMVFGHDNYWQLADNISGFHYMLPSTPEGPRRHLPTCNLSVRRGTALEIGPFRADLATSADLDWSIRLRQAGHRLYFDPRPVIFHQSLHRTPQAVWRHWLNYGRDGYLSRQRLAAHLGTPPLPRQAGLLLALAPAVAVWATLRTFARPATWRYGHTLPMVLLTKLAWCLGGFEGIVRAAPEGAEPSRP
jgi:GT2 family glycosyltransferase